MANLMRYGEVGKLNVRIWKSPAQLEKIPLKYYTVVADLDIIRRSRDYYKQVMNKEWGEATYQKVVAEEWYPTEERCVLVEMAAQ